MKTQSSQELDRLIVLLKDNPRMEIEISGHIDNQGADDYNLKLSQKRTLAYLIGTGIAAARLSAKGYGESKPIATNDN